MNRAGPAISDADRQRVDAAVREAESRTSAEIVPVIARCSGRYDRPEDIVGLWTALVALAVAWWLLPSRLDSGAWGSLSGGGVLLVLLVSTGAGFVLGALLAERVDGLRRLFTPTNQMIDEVNQRARALFYDQRVHHTTNSTGLLIYISLFEHRATLIADQKLLATIGQTQLDLFCEALTHRLHNQPLIDALCATIEEIGHQLQTAAPRQSGEPNQLADSLILIND